MGVAVLDSSVLIGVLDASDAHHQAGLAALRRAVDAGDELLVPAVAYAEVLVGAIRQAGEGGRTTVDALLSALPASVVPIEAAFAAAAANLRARHARLKLPDALVIATALARRGSRIVTADHGWPTLPGVTVELLG